jgi:hypothetical protein
MLNISRPCFHLKIEQKMKLIYIEMHKKERKLVGSAKFELLEINSYEFCVSSR